jgi:hypothetical protein
MSLRFNHSTKAWEFSASDGWCALRNPYGPPSARQLLALSRAGLLELRDEPGEPITKLGAAWAIDRAGIARRRTDDELADEILAYVAEHPGTLWRDVRLNVRGASVRLAWIRKQLMLDRRLFIQRQGQAMRLYLSRGTTELGA